LLHNARERAPENLGEAPLHLRMLPSLKIDLPENAPPQLGWDTLFHAAKHYLRLLFASTPSTVLSKTAIGMSVVFDAGGNTNSGFQRIVYPVGTPNDAVAMVLGNVAHLARSLITHGRDKRAVLVLGVVLPNGTLHFDALFVVLNGNLWTIRGIKPMWAQILTKVNEHTYKMHHLAQGEKPDQPYLGLALAERALMPTETTPPTTSACRQGGAPIPPPRRSGQEPPAEAAPARDRPLPASGLEWEQHRKRAQQQVKEATVAPQWTEQLRQALQH
jgi:hypothetical protein